MPALIVLTYCDSAVIASDALLLLAHMSSPIQCQTMAPVTDQMVATRRVQHASHFLPALLRYLQCDPILQLQASKALNKRERRAAQKALKAKQLEQDTTTVLKNRDNGLIKSASSVGWGANTTGFESSQVMVVLSLSCFAFAYLAYHQASFDALVMLDTHLCNIKHSRHVFTISSYLPAVMMLAYTVQRSKHLTCSLASCGN